MLSENLPSLPSDMELALEIVLRWWSDLSEDGLSDFEYSEGLGHDLGLDGSAIVRMYCLPEGRNQVMTPDWKSALMSLGVTEQSTMAGWPTSQSACVQTCTKKMSPSVYICH